MMMMMIYDVVSNKGDDKDVGKVFGVFLRMQLMLKQLLTHNLLFGKLFSHHLNV